MRIFLGLCSNLGDREAYLINARDLLMKAGVLVLGQSEIRETKPLGDLDQPDYLNQVIEVASDLGPMDLLSVCKNVELEMGRPPKKILLGNVAFGSKEVEKPENLEVRWESRIIDIDILYYGDKVIEDSFLRIPHPGAAERIFELQGMCDIAPNFQDPVHKKSMKELMLEA